MVLVKWHGHACFELRSSTGFTVVIDPHDGASIGLKPPKAEADLVLVTHEHFDHNQSNIVAKPDATVLSMREGEVRIGPVTVKGVKLYHDKMNGRLRGEVIAYLVEVDGIKFLHLGDLGHTLTDEQAEALGKPDVVFVPVGGTYTIGPHEAKEVVDKLDPPIAVPMHYWVPGLQLPLRPVTDFLALIKDRKVERLEGREAEITSDSLGEKKVLVFSL